MRTKKSTQYTMRLPPDLSDKIKAARPEEGAGGTLAIDENHNAVKRVYIVGYRDGKLVDLM